MSCLINNTHVTQVTRETTNPTTLHRPIRDPDQIMGILSSDRIIIGTTAVGFREFPETTTGFRPRPPRLQHQGGGRYPGASYHDQNGDGNERGSVPPFSANGQHGLALALASLLPQSASNPNQGSYPNGNHPSLPSARLNLALWRQRSPGRDGCSR
jgi:hypothetical protein